MTTARDPATRAPADDRDGVQPPAERVPGHLDLEDPLPRGSGAAEAAPDTRRIPPLRRGGRRAPAHDPAPPARRVPAAAGDPAGAGVADARPQPAAADRAFGGGGADARRRVQASGSGGGARARARGVRPARPERQRQGQALRRERRRDRLRVRQARALRNRPAHAPPLPDVRGPGGERDRAAGRAVPALAQPRAAQGRDGGPPGARQSSPRSSRSFSSGATCARSLAARWWISRSKIREVPDFPTPGIGFKDIMPLLADADALHEAVDRMARVGGAAHARDRGRRGGARILPRRRSRLPARLRVRSRPAAGKAAARDDQARRTSSSTGRTCSSSRRTRSPAGRVFSIHDDVLATGGTARAMAELVEDLGGVVVGFTFLIELTFLNGRERIPGYDVCALDRVLDPQRPRRSAQFLHVRPAADALRASLSGAWGDRGDAFGFPAPRAPAGRVPSGGLRDHVRLPVRGRAPGPRPARRSRLGAARAGRGLVRRPHDRPHRRGRPPSSGRSPPAAFGPASGPGASSATRRTGRDRCFPPPSRSWLRGRRTGSSGSPCVSQLREPVDQPRLAGPRRPAVPQRRSGGRRRARLPRPTPCERWTSFGPSSTRARSTRAG